MTYIDVLADAEAMAAMLKINKGRRDVPVIVEDGRISVGFGGT